MHLKSFLLILLESCCVLLRFLTDVLFRRRAQQLLWRRTATFFIRFSVWSRPLLAATLSVFCFVLFREKIIDYYRITCKYSVPVVHFDVIVRVRTSPAAAAGVLWQVLMFGSYSSLNFRTCIMICRSFWNRAFMTTLFWLLYRWISRIHESTSTLYHLFSSIKKRNCCLQYFPEWLKCPMPSERAKFMVVSK